jgi:ribose/xylose/arabinose/galactoside ABC-type transport system permease subunit
MKLSLRWLQRTEWILAAAILAVVLLTGALDTQHTYFKTPADSAIDILRQTSLLGIFTLGAAIVIIAGGIDLSSGSVIAFSGTVCATLMLLLAPQEMQLKVKWHRLDAQAMQRLAKDQLPSDLLAKLQPRVPETFTSTEDFQAMLRKALTEDEYTDNEDLLVRQTEFPKPLGLGVIVVGIAGSLVVGFLVGSLHAWLITVVNLPPFVATLATLVGLRSLGRALVENVTTATGMGKSTQIQIFDTQFRYLATSVWIPAVLFLVLALATWLLMSRSVVGRHLHALGGNEQAARLSGIRTDQLKWLAYCISALLASVAGVLFIGEESVANPQNQGRGYELNAIAAAVVGGCSLQGGVGTMQGAILGALFLRIVIDGVAKIIKTGADVYEGLIVGGVVVIAVALTQLRQVSRGGKRFFPGGLGIVNIITLSVLTGMMTMLFVASKERSGTLAGGIAALAAFLLFGLVALTEHLRARKAGDQRAED